jgi:hypothetical protein
MNKHFFIYACALALYLVPLPVLAQRQTLPLFPSAEDYQNFVSGLPTASTVRNGAKVADAHFNYGLGAQFNLPVSLSVILCERDTAYQEMSSSVDKVLLAHKFSLGTGWDPKYWVLKATMTNGHDVDPKSVSSENVDLQIKLDQANLRERALTFSYQVFSCIRPNDTCQDISTDDQVKRYMDSLLYEMRQKIEATLSKSCTRDVVHEITTKDDAIEKLVLALHLTSAQEAEVRAAVGDKNAR